MDLVERESDLGAIRALGARGSELEREFPFGVIRQLLEPALVGVDREAAFAGAATAARPVFEGETSEGATFAVLHGLYWLTLNVGAERPLVLAVDDLHWCDRPSGLPPREVGTSTVGDLRGYLWAYGAHFQPRQFLTD
jgi:hypothetical protein